MLRLVIIILFSFAISGCSVFSDCHKLKKAKNNISGSDIDISMELVTDIYIAEDTTGLYIQVVSEELENNDYGALTLEQYITGYVIPDSDSRVKIKYLQ